MKNQSSNYFCHFGQLLAEIEATGHVLDTEEETNVSCCNAEIDEFGRCKDCKEECK